MCPGHTHTHISRPCGRLCLTRGSFFWLRLPHQAKMPGVSSAANSPSVLVPPSTFCLWVALCVTRRLLALLTDLPANLHPKLFMEEVSSRLLLLQLGQELPLPLRPSQICRTSVPNIFFNHFCPSLKITNKGKSFTQPLYQRVDIKKVGWPRKECYPLFECLKEGRPT